jgi:hypothetical protein
VGQICLPSAVAESDELGIDCGANARLEANQFLAALH